MTGDRQNRLVIFRVNIIRRIRVRDFNCELENGLANIKAFPDTTSRELFHYATPKLEDSNFNEDTLHFGTNDLLQNRNTVEPLITVTSAQRPPPDLRSVKKVPAEFKVKLS